MGDYFAQTMKKCIAGTVYAAVKGQPISPSTQENCAVAVREAKEMAQKAQILNIDPQDARKLMPPPRAKANILFREEIIFRKNSNPRELREKLEKLLQDLPPEQREQIRNQLKAGRGGN